MRLIRITIEAEIAEGAIEDADRLARHALEETARFSFEGKPDWVHFESEGFSGPFEFDSGRRPDTERAP